MPKPNPRDVLRQQLYGMMHGGAGMSWAQKVTGIHAGRLLQFVGNPNVGHQNEALTDNEVTRLLALDLPALHADAKPAKHEVHHGKPE